jgi:outer membrane protein W
MNMNKKVVMTVVLAGATTLAMAQKPTEGAPHSVEVQMNLTGDVNTIVAPTLKYRYFLSENMAIRFGLGFNGSKETNNFTENADGTGATGSQELQSSSWEVAPGFEYHFAGTDRLSPYLGVAIAIGGGKDTETWTNSDGSQYVEDLSADVENPFSTFGVGLLAGADFYFAENFFVGAEFGYLISSVTEKEGSISVSAGGTTTSATTPERKFSANGFGETAAIRLGWRF